MATRIFILRVGRENSSKAETALTLITNLQDYEKKIVAGHAPIGCYTPAEHCRIRTLHVSGTLEKVECRYKEMSEAWLETA